MLSRAKLDVFVLWNQTCRRKRYRARNFASIDVPSSLACIHYFPILIEIAIFLIDFRQLVLFFADLYTGQSLSLLCLANVR